LMISNIIRRIKAFQKYAIVGIPKRKRSKIFAQDFGAS
jgi:hypothetical protein